MARDRFIDPAGDRATYDWPINHNEEQEGGQSRSVSHLANTGNVGLVRSQGDKTPMRLVWSGTILQKSQLKEMYEWFELCEDQSIYVRDFAGDEYEVLITDFKPSRKRTARNPKDSAIPYHYWTYSIEMEVLKIRDGDLEGVVSP